MGTDDQRVSPEERTGVSAPAAKSLTTFTDSMPAWRSELSTAQAPSPTEGSAGGCTACGCDVELLHRFKEDEAIQNLCTSCILFLCKGMYCCLCFGVYENSVEGSDSARRLTCAKCHRTSHLSCAHNGSSPMVSTAFTCKDCSKLENIAIKESITSTGDCTENGSTPLKKLRLSSDQQISPEEEALTAARIVAFLAVKQAKEAKARARALAGAAAGAASRAKAALDVAYRSAFEEARWKPEPSRRFVGALHGKNRGLFSLSVVKEPIMSRTDGRVSLTNLQHLNSHTPSHKIQLGKEPTSFRYTPSNARFGCLHDKMKGLRPGAETMKTSTSSQDAFPRASVSQKPSAVQMEGVDCCFAIESEGPLVNASPASILDAARSLDIPSLSSLTKSSSAHTGMPQCNENTSSSSVLKRDDQASRCAQLPTVSKDQLTTIESKASEEVSTSAS